MATSGATFLLHKQEVGIEEGAGKLEKLGLSELFPIWESEASLENRWGILVELRPSEPYAKSRSPFGLADSIIKGMADPKEGRLFLERYNFNPPGNNFFRELINRLVYDKGQRLFLESMVEIAPGSIGPLLERVRDSKANLIFDPGNGGGYFLPSYDSKKPDKVVIGWKDNLSDRAIDRQYIVITGLHENQHFLDQGFRYDNMGKYYGLQEYLDFRSLEQQKLDEILTSYFSADWEKVKRYKLGEYMFGDPNDKFDPGRLGRISGVFSYDELQFYESLGGPERQNYFIHALGKKRLNWIKSGIKRANPFTGGEYFFGEARDGTYDIALRDYFIKQIHVLVHFAVGPLQKKGGGIPGDLKEIHPKDDSEFFEIYNPIEAARIGLWNPFYKSNQQGFYNAMSSVADRMVWPITKSTKSSPRY